LIININKRKRRRGRRLLIMKTKTKQTEDDFVDHSKKVISIQEFINNELYYFSKEDCRRSIPSMIDGFKPGQRKIIYACFKKNLNSEMKVAQLAGYVAEHTAYHHGEQSLMNTMVGMAQDFVGSNNINLLFPAGQFGTRLMVCFPSFLFFFSSSPRSRSPW
jgi:DNA topoisomerase II